ncbi:MAG TPA: acyltransferase [Nevskiaceae bacterium]|nr:acyltransferase [Nevskiaceae bacterium]
MKRIVELDGLRGLFCLGVVFYHVRQDWLFWYWSAMDWFFMLSGFVITANLLQNRRANNLLSMFFLRRALRIWPLYYLGLVVGLTIFVIGMQLGYWSSVRNSAWLQQALFVQYFEGYWRTLDFDSYPFHLRHTWSLAVEEQFYVIWALAFVAFRRTRWIVPVTAILFIAIGVASHLHHVHLYMLTGHMEAFGLGLLLAWLFVGERADSLRPYLGRLFAIAAVVSIPLWGGYVLEGYRRFLDGDDRLLKHGPLVNFGFALLWFALTGAVALRPSARACSLLRQRLSVYLGEMCYSLYLVHYAAITLTVSVGRYYGYDPALLAIAGAMLGVFIAHLVHRYIEQPLLDRKVSLRYRYDAPGPGLIARAEA